MIQITLKIKGNAPIKIVIVHGFNVYDGGAGSIDRIIPYLLQMFPNAVIDADNTDYKHGLIKVRFFSKKTVSKIADTISDADVVITHSNGANYTMKALKLLKKQNRENEQLHITHISPALNRKQKLHRYKFRRIDVLFSKSDRVVWLSRWLPFHAWGNAGQRGLITTDKRYGGHEFDGTYHSGWFSTLSLPTLGDFLGELIIDKR
jgi:hypothetical protein